MNTLKDENRKADDLFKQVDNQVARYTVLVEAHKASEALCGNDPQNWLPTDFLQAVHNYRQSINVLLGRLNALKAVLLLIEEADMLEDPTLWIDLNQQFQILLQDGEKLLRVGAAIIKVHNHFVPTPMWN